MRLLARPLYGKPSDVAAYYVAWEEPFLGFARSPPIAQGLEQLWGEHDEAIFTPFTLSDSNDHSLTIDIADLQGDRLRDAQSGSVASRQDSAMLDAPHTAQKLQHFFRTQDHRQLVRALGGWNNFFQAPILTKCESAG